QAQIERNERITDRVLAQLELMRERTGAKDADLPMVTHGTCTEPRNVDVTLDPGDRLPGTLWGTSEEANYRPTTLGVYSSLQSWLSQWSLRTSHAHGPDRLADVDVPVHVIYGTADTACFPAHARSLYEAAPADRRVLTPIVGGLHYLNDQPELTNHMA